MLYNLVTTRTTIIMSHSTYRLPFETYFGGVQAFTKGQFEAVNGFTNLLFGWGGEDDDMMKR